MSRPLLPAVFLDLNGTLVLPVQAGSPHDFCLIPGTVESVRLLNAAGFVCPVVTVQSRIAKGVYSQEAFLDWFAAFRAMLSSEGAEITGPYVCPHRSSDKCDCAKPQPKLYLQAAEEHGIDLTRSFVVGDSAGDVLAAVSVGMAGGCYVRTGWGPRPGDEREKDALFVGDDLLAVARWMVSSAAEVAQANRGEEGKVARETAVTTS